MSSTLTTPASMQAPAPPPNALDTTPGANPTEPVVQYQLSSGHVASLPQSSVPALMNQDSGAKQIPSPADGEVLVQLSSGHTATLPSTSLPALKAQDPNYKYIAGTGPTDAPDDYLSKTENFINQSVKGGVSHAGDMLRNTANFIEQAYPNFVEGTEELPADYRAYETARSQGKSPVEAFTYASGVTKMKDDAVNAISSRLKEFKTNPGSATGKALVDLIPMIATLGIGAAPEAAVESGAAETGAVAAPEAIEAKIPSASDFTSPAKPNIFKQVIQGKNVAQPGAQQAVRQGVQAATENAGTADESVAANIENQPLLSRNQTIMDQHLSALRGLEQDAYDRMDEAAGFDVKAEKTQLANDQYKLKQLGNTDADAAMKDKLTDSIKDSQARIADAESKMQDAGVDPTEADTIHKQRMAGADFRKALIQNTSSDGQTVNVDGLVNAAKKLQYTKYGDRLQQFFGSPEAADDFMSNLEQAQKQGISAAKKQQLAKWVGGLVGLGTAVHGVGQMIP
jgi:hypothetical protein